MEGENPAFWHTDHSRDIARNIVGFLADMMFPALPKLIRGQMENNNFWKCTFWELGAAEQSR